MAAACQTSPKDEFSQLKPGMYKHEVLGIMGSPQRTQRWRGLDRWTYIYFEERDRAEKEVHFSEGKAAYVGGSFVPAVSAADQDQIYEAQNIELEKEFAAQREAARKVRNLQLPTYEEDVSGTNEIRYVPQYAPMK